VAAIGTGEAFERGRDFGAWLGLMPRQHSTGGRSSPHLQAGHPGGEGPPGAPAQLGPIQRSVPCDSSIANSPRRRLLLDAPSYSASANDSNRRAAVRCTNERTTVKSSTKPSRSRARTLAARLMHCASSICRNAAATCVRHGS
jgi:hypothetical protein